MEFDKNRVYTAVNADELRIGDRVIVADTIEILKEKISENCEPINLECVFSENSQCRFSNGENGWMLAYLVERAPEKKWRPYKDCDEMVADYKRRVEINDKDGIGLPRNPMWHPLIWVKNKISAYTALITDFSRDYPYVFLRGEELQLSELFEDYTYMDGSPCGIEE